VKEPVSLTLEDNERPNGTTLILSATGKPMAWVPDTYAVSHIADTVSTPGAAAHQAYQHKITKYFKLLCTHVLPHCHRNSKHMGWHGHWQCRQK